jgi:cobyrinic acid a,c-diamide synthase
VVEVPRIVVAGTHSGVGKTTIASGLMATLRAKGQEVAPFKVGPDFIDPSYHTLAAGRPGRNLDAFLSGPELIGPLFAHGAWDADVAVVEGVMGLFDGKSGGGEYASTAHVAKLLRAPVLLVVDAGAMARSAAAIVYGYATFDPELRVAGVILNRVGSARPSTQWASPSSASSAATQTSTPLTATSASSPPPSAGKKLARRSIVRTKRSPAPATLRV